MRCIKFKSRSRVDNYKLADKMWSSKVLEDTEFEVEFSLSM